jgi:pSer/pThr/pTyr-binding forkhead associated (FHA) protein
MKSTAGTFLNDQRLGLPCQFSEPHILKEGDIIQLGKDIQYRGKGNSK